MPAPHRRADLLRRRVHERGPDQVGAFAERPAGVRAGWRCPSAAAGTRRTQGSHPHARGRQRRAAAHGDLAGRAAVARPGSARPPSVCSVTTVLLVRHGLTAMTRAGARRLDPGRAPRRARRAAGGGRSPQRLRPVPLAAIVTSPLERCQRDRRRRSLAGRDARRRSRRPAAASAATATGPAAAQGARQGPAVEGRAGAPERGDVPRREGESMRAMQHARGRRGPGLERQARPGRDLGGLQPRRRHQGRSLADALGMHLDQFQRHRVDPCSVSVIRYTALRPFVVRLNDTGGERRRLLPRRKKRAAAGARRRTRRRRGRRRRARTGADVGSSACPARSSSSRPAGPLRRRHRRPARRSAPSTCRPAAAARVTSVALEKQQVAALAERLDELLDEVLRRTAAPAVPAVAPRSSTTSRRSTSRSMEEFRVGTLALAWDGDAERRGHRGARRAAEAATTRTTRATTPSLQRRRRRRPGDVLRVRLSPAAAPGPSPSAPRAVVAAGRPPCPFCGQPLDPRGISARGRTATGALTAPTWCGARDRGAATDGRRPGAGRTRLDLLRER